MKRLFCPGAALVLLTLLLGGAAWAAVLPRLEVKAASGPLALETELIVRRTAPRLAAWLGDEPPHIRVEVAPDREAFAQRMRQLNGPQWAAGLAVSGSLLIVVRSPAQLTQPGDFAPLLIHELTHLYLDHALRGRWAPVWLHEGLAMYASGEGGWALGATMARAVLGEGLEPFTRLADGFPQEADRASLAYAQSYYFISYLLNTHGEQVLTRLVTELVKGRELSDAMRRATGRGLARVEQEFREAMEDRFSWLALLTAGGVVWALVALVAGVGLVLRRRAHRRRLAAWPEKSQTAREEPLAGRHWPPPPRRGGVLAEAGQETAPDGASRQSKKANSGERAVTSAQDE